MLMKISADSKRKQQDNEGTPKAKLRRKEHCSRTKEIVANIPNQEKRSVKNGWKKVSRKKERK